MPTTIKEHVTAEQVRAKAAIAWRSAEVLGVDEANRTVELAFSSEAEVPRWFGVEVLSHADGAVDLSRLNDGGALLMDHDRTDQVGVIESSRIDADQKGRAMVRFGKSARASEIFQDVVDKIRRHVSVGYQINAIKWIEERDDGTDVYTVTSWTPTEISFVSIPADTTVGVGRASDVGNPHVETPLLQPENRGVPDKPANEILPVAIKETRSMPDNTQDPQTIDADAVRRAGGEAERARVRTINEMGDKFGAADLARSFVNDGKTVDDFQRALLEHVNTRQARPLSEQTLDASLGLTDKEVSGYRFMNVVRALANPADQKAQKAAAFEFEAGRAAADKYGKEAKGVMIPAEVLARSLNLGSNGQAGAGSTGGNAVATNLYASAFIDMLKNQTTIMQLARILGGLVGNVDIPKKTGRSQGYWLGEEQNATAGAPDLGQIALSPKSVAAYTDISRKFMQQSSLDAEALVRTDLAEALGLAIDLAGYYGTGTAHQPLGIANYVGIHAQPFAAVQPTFAELVGMETQIATANADVNGMAYVANAKFRGAAKTTLKFQAAGSATIWEQGDSVNGYQTRTTNQIADGDVFFGNFADVLIGMWGGLDLTVDPYSLSQSGGTRIVVFQDVDVVLRRVESFTLGRKAP